MEDESQEMKSSHATPHPYSQVFVFVIVNVFYYKERAGRGFVHHISGPSTVFSCANVATILHKKKRPKPLFFVIMLNNTFCYGVI